MRSAWSANSNTRITATAFRSMKRLIVARRCFQVFFLLLFVYVFAPAARPLTDLISPRIFSWMDPFMTITLSISERVLLPGLLFSFLMLVLTFVLGRFFCGWICPLGTMIDSIGALKKKRNVSSERTNGKIRSIKFYVLGLIAALAVFGMQKAWILDPIVIMSRFVSLDLRPTIAGLGITLLPFLITCGAALFIPRLWCRGACPLGALYAIVARFAVLKRVVGKCSNCRTCVNSCRMGAIKEDTGYHKGECILCMDCVYNCPQHVTRFTPLRNGTLT